MQLEVMTSFNMVLFYVPGALGKGNLLEHMPVQWLLNSLIEPFNLPSEVTRSKIDRYKRSGMYAQVIEVLQNALRLLLSSRKLWNYLYHWNMHSNACQSLLFSDLTF